MISAQVLGDCELFKGLPERDREEMVHLCREGLYGKGATIFTEGDGAETLYVLLEGMVGLRIHPAGRKEFMVGTVRNRGEAIGWSALVEPRRYTASAVCLEDCRVLAMRGTDLLAWLEREPRVGFQVVRRLAAMVSSRLQETRSHLLTLLSSGVIDHG